jgi:hypothetical protein
VHARLKKHIASAHTALRRDILHDSQVQILVRANPNPRIVLGIATILDLLVLRYKLTIQFTTMLFVHCLAICGAIRLRKTGKPA